jgi:hypothetical protein
MIASALIPEFIGNQYWGRINRSETVGGQNSQNSQNCGLRSTSLSPVEAKRDIGTLEVQHPGEFRFPPEDLAPGFQIG